MRYGIHYSIFFVGNIGILDLSAGAYLIKIILVTRKRDSDVSDQARLKPAYLTAEICYFGRIWTKKYICSAVQVVSIRLADQT